MSGLSDLFPKTGVFKGDSNSTVQQPARNQLNQVIKVYVISESHDEIMCGLYDVWRRVLTSLGFFPQSRNDSLVMRKVTETNTERYYSKHMTRTLQKCKSPEKQGKPEKLAQVRGNSGDTGFNYL